MEDNQGSKHQPIDPAKIYPDAVENTPSAQHENSSIAHIGMAEANADMKMRGIKAESVTKKSREIDIIGGLIIFSGAFSLAINHNPINLVYSLIYLIVG